MRTASFKVVIKLWTDVTRAELRTRCLSSWAVEIVEALKAKGFEPVSVKGILPTVKRKGK